MKRNLLYYLYPRTSSVWRWHIEQLQKYWGAFNGRKIIVIAADQHTKASQKVLPVLAPLNAELVWVNNDPALGETKHFLEKLSLLESRDPQEATFYAHAKGVTQTGPWLAGAVSWSKGMYDLNLGNISAVEKALSLHSAVGCFKHLMNHGGARWHYSGTFFWFKHSTLFSRNWRSIEQSRFGVEGYIGRHLRWGEMGAFTPDNVGPVWLYRGGVTDAYIELCKSYWGGRAMHGSVMNYLRAKVDQVEVQGKEILEIGGYNVNGTPRDVFIPFGPREYLGIDQEAGPWVDRVMDASNLVTELGVDKFDVVVSTEMLEHAQDWRKAVSNMKAVTKPGGLLFVTTRGPGFPFHGFPHDFWRYTVEDFNRIFSDMEVLDLASDPEFPGVFIKCRKPMDFKPVDLSTIQVAPAPPPPPPPSPVPAPALAPVEVPQPTRQGPSVGIVISSPPHQTSPNQGYRQAPGVTPMKH